MLVRSPTLTKSDSVGDVQRLEAGQPHRRTDSGGDPWRLRRRRSGDRRDVRRRGPAAAADEVDQAGVGELAEDRGGLVRRPRRTRRTRWAGRRWGSTRRTCRRSATARRCRAASPWRRARSSGRRRSGRAWRTEFQNASVVWPDSVRPEASVIVPEMITGQRRPCSSNSGLEREDRRLGVQRVEDRLDQRAGRRRRRRGPRGLLEYAATSCVEVDVAGARVVDVGGDRRRPGGRAERAGDVARLVRRSATASHAPAREPRGLVVELVGELLHAVVDRARCAVALNVLVSMMSAPASRYSPWMSAMISRLGEREQVVVALHVGGPVGEPLAAVAGLVRPVPLDRRAHRAVDDQDPLAAAAR